MVKDVPSVTKPKDKVMYGTKNMAMEPAMSREQAAQAVLIGIRKVKELAEQGYDLIATGEIGEIWEYNDKQCDCVRSA